MSNYAIIIGADRYDNAAWNLDAAVRDALRFASWAIRSGDVPPQNLKLLLSPVTEGLVVIPKTPFSIPSIAATSRNLKSVLFDDFQKNTCGAGSTRLYFYYAGHGCSHPDVRGQRAEPVLVFPDVADLPRDYSDLLSFSDILAVLRGCEPTEQFFFLDACRDFTLKGLGSAGPGGGRYIRPITMLTAAAPAKQFVLYATCPGGKAQEIKGKGVFGEALLRALKGDPAAVQRVAGAGDYELKFENLYEYVKAEVVSNVVDLADAANIQLPERDAEPSETNPLVLGFSEAEMEERELLIRMAPDLALNGGRLTVFYERYPMKGPIGPPLNAATGVLLKPAHYSIEAESPTFERQRTRPFRHPGKPLELTLAAVPAGGATSQGAPSPMIGFTVGDQTMYVTVTAPDGKIEVGLGGAAVSPASPGLYRVRIVSPEGNAQEQAFEYPFNSGWITLNPPKPQIRADQMAMLQNAGIYTTPDGMLKPSEVLGNVSNLKPASLLGFAAYAAYTLSPATGGSRLRTFGLEPVAPERRSEAWLSVLLNVEGSETFPGAFHDRSSVAIYADKYLLGKFRTLPGFPAAAQHLQSITEGNVTVEVRLPDIPPTRFPLTCFAGRVATLCLNVKLPGGEMDIQMYLMPFDWNQLDHETVRLLEQAQRFYSGSEPMPELMTEQLLNMKSFDPLLGAMAGYTLIRQGKPERYRGTPDPELAAGAWNPQSAMQNMLTHFDLLPDSHILAGLCEPDKLPEHFANAAARGVPLFSEGFRALLDSYDSRRDQLSAGLWHARRTLAAGSAFSAWLGFEPALEIEQGKFAKPPAVWSALSEHRARIESQLRAVGAVELQSAEGARYRTGFLVTPELVLTANHTVNLGTPVSFTLFDNIDDARASRVALSVVAVDDEARLALLRLSAPITSAEALAIAPEGALASRDDRIYLIGYPFLQYDLDPELVKHVFGERLGEKRLQPGYVVGVRPGKVDHDAFTLEGSAGSPVISMETGLVLGLHWGGMNQANFKRGRASALWNERNRKILRDAGVVP
jgi:Trypsin-like peptidase domain/Caspase domain